MITEIIDRNLKNLQQAKGYFQSGYPKYNGIRKYYNVHHCIAWRIYAMNMRKRFEKLLTEHAPDEILRKMSNKFAG